jgi:general secretion pathway protein J
MTGSLATKRSGEAGFTLIETLVALALTGLVLAALANLTSQWLPNWNRGVDRIQRSEQVALAMERIAADLAAAEYVSANRKQRQPLFDGSELSVTFVRTAFGPNAVSGLDVVRIGETVDQREFVTVRSRAAFVPLSPGGSLSEQIHTGDPVVLLRAPFRLSFSYAGPDRIWKPSWHDADKLPVAIRLTVRDSKTERLLPISTVVSLHTQAPAAGQCDTPGQDCDAKPGDTQPDSSASANSTAGSAGAAAAQVISQ